VTDEQPPETPATVALRAAGVPHQIVQTQPANSAEESAQLQGIELRQLLRTGR
jgi:hypothetical protein